MATVGDGEAEDPPPELPMLPQAFEKYPSLLSARPPPPPPPPPPLEPALGISGGTCPALAALLSMAAPPMPYAFWNCMAAAYLAC